MAVTTLGPFQFLEAGHTEEGANRGKPLTICDAELNDVAQVFSADDSTVSIPREKAVATAHLFAAAPALLFELSEAASQLEGWVSWKCPAKHKAEHYAYIAKLRALIARASGSAHG